jgi:hypothetical protein
MDVDELQLQGVVEQGMEDGMQEPVAEVNRIEDRMSRRHSRGLRSR